MTFMLELGVCTTLKSIVKLLRIHTGTVKKGISESQGQLLTNS